MSSNQSVENRAESNVNLKMLSGLHTGQVKWFNRRRGYGFIKILESRQNEESNESFIGKDVFVHQSHIKPQKSTYRSLEENEYVELGLSVDDKNVTQAVNVTGILGGTLLCDVPNTRPVRQQQNSSEEGDFQEPKYNQRSKNRHFRSNRNRTEDTSQETETSERGGDGNYFRNLNGNQ